MSSIVIGGGVIGTTLAFRLAATGTEVTLIEAGPIGGATTGASFSMHIATRKTPKEHFDLAVEGGREHHKLAEDLGASQPDSTWIHPAPCYEWPANGYEEKLIDDRVERLRSWGYEARWISLAELRGREPHLVPGNGVHRVALYENEAWYDAPLLARLAAEGATRHGARIITGERVTTINRSDGGVSVATSAGKTHAADNVVIAAGAKASHVASLAGLQLPVNEVPGYVVTTDPVPANTLNGIVLHPDINIRPAPEARIAYHSYLMEGRLPRGLEIDPDNPAAAKITELAATLLPSLAEVPRHRAKTGSRPVPMDGLPIVGWLDENQQVYSVAAHSGVNFAPALARLACTEMVEGAVPEQLRPFRPARPGLNDPAAGEMDESTREMHRMFAESRS